MDGLKNEHGILTSDARILEERINAARKEIAAKYRFWTSITFIIIVALFAFAIILRLIKQKRTVHQALDNAIEEKQQLEKLLESGTQLSQDMTELLSGRIKALNDVIIVHLTGRKSMMKDSSTIIESLTDDRNGFILGVAMQYSLSHPAFVKHLKSYGLSNWEIGYCCLFLIGMTGKDIAGYILSSSATAYGIASRIRQKFGLGPHDTNLSKYVKETFQSYQ